MKPIQRSSQAMIMEQADNITTSIYTWVPLNHSFLNIIQREFWGFFSRVERLNNGLTVKSGLYAGYFSTSHGMAFIWCWTLWTYFDICGPLQKAWKGHTLKLDEDVQEDVVQWFPQQSKEFFADGICQNMQLKHPWSDSPFQPVSVKICTNFTVRGQENMECVDAMISTLWNVTKGDTVLGDSEVDILQ